MIMILYNLKRMIRAINCSYDLLAIMRNMLGKIKYKERRNMNYSYGLLGIRHTISENKKERQRKEMLPDPKKVLDREMQEFCEKKAAEYGITRGINLDELQRTLIKESYFYQEIPMQNEDAVPFLEKEREEIAFRRDAMFDRIKRLPIEGQYAPDKSDMRVGRQNGVMKEGGPNSLLKQAEKYLENSGIDFPTEEFLQRFHYQAGVILNEIDKDIAILRKGIAGEEYVNEQLRLYEGKYKVLQNIVLESVDSQGNTSEVDAYIITDRGLVVAEIKNYGNENQRLHITNDGRWVMEDVYSGSILRRIDHSPVEQNTRHCLAVERLLRQEFGEDCNIPVIPVIFIANNKVNINNESKSSVIRVSEFYTFINSIQNTASISKEMQAKIENLLNAYNIGAQEFKIVSRRMMMDSLEKMEKVFSGYVLYNHEVAEEYQKAVIRNTPVKEKRKREMPKPSIMTIVLCLIPYLPILLFGWTPEFRIVLLVGYTIMLFSIPLGLLAGIILFCILIG